MEEITYKNWEKEKWMLRELKKRKLIEIKDPSTSGNSNLMNMEFAPNMVFLDKAILVEDKNIIELDCKTQRGGDRKGGIRSKNLELLKEIKNEIEVEGLIGKSIDKIFSTRIKINRKFLENKNDKK